jgi:TatD DNase family protein
VKLVDSHCHLDSPKFRGDLAETIARARAAGVERFLAVGTGEGPPDLEAALRLAEAHDGFFATIGVHPHDASKATPETFERLRELARHPKAVAFGEIGLDYHYDFSPRGVQASVFVEQLRIAADAQLPIVIHTREAWSETTRLLREHWNERPGIMHCFTGGPDEVREALDLGFHVSFGGVITFPKSDENRRAAALVPDDRLLVETDAPFLAPAPHRGKRNEPAFMVETVRKLAEIRGADPERIGEITSANFERLCLPQGEPAGYTGEIP